MSINNHPYMREFSMFFNATLSVLGIIALLMMNMIIDKMDASTEQQHAISLTLTAFMASTSQDIKTLSKNQDTITRIQRKRTSTVDRAERYFINIDRK